MSSKSYEYENIKKINSVDGNYFTVPIAIIVDSMNKGRALSVFSFFSVHRGINNIILFSVDYIAKWLGKKPDRHSHGINGKLIEGIRYLQAEGYIYLSDEPNGTSLIDGSFDTEKISTLCNKEKFAIVYLDELRKIINYKNPDSKDAYVNSENILKVFTFLRSMIPRRKNELRPEENNVLEKRSHKLDIETRRKNCPEAYNCFYCELADWLGLSARTISKIVDILSELELIYFEPLPRIKNAEGKWRTDHTLFCNYYKREGHNLLDYGSEYYEREIKNKKAKLIEINML